MNADAITTAGAIVAGLVIIEIVRAVVAKFVNTEYVTRRDCEKCRSACQERTSSDKSDLKADMRVVKRLLLVLATKAGVDEKYLQGLVE